MPEQLWHEQCADFFESLSHEHLRRLERRARVREFPRGSLIYHPIDEADGVLALLVGRIKLTTITPEGKQALLGWVEPGELFGELALFERGRREEFAEALTKSRVVWIPTDELVAVVEAAPTLALRFSRLLSARQRLAQRRLRYLLFRSTRERIANLLLELVERYGSVQAQGTLIDQRITHQELANIIGATRESVTLALNELQQMGIVSLGRQRVVIRDSSRLRNVAEGETPETDSASQ